MRIFSRLSLLAIFLLVFLTVSAAAQIANCGNLDYACLIAAYTKQISTNPNDIEAYYERGRAFMSNENFDQAIADFSHYISMNPAKKEYLADGYNNRATCYKHKNSLDMAIADYNKAIQLVPTNPLYYDNRGNVYSEKKSFDQAIADFSSAISSKPEYSTAYVGRGHAYMGKNDYPSAFADFTKAIQINPDEAEAYYNRAIIHNSRKDFEKAIADYDKYIMLNTSNIPFLSDGYQNRALAYLDIGNLAQALKDLTAAIDLEPTRASLYKSRAIVYRKQGKVALAEADERKAASLLK
ncbi:MAG: tetratricopeptide repeat protein [Pyrinomonadaceae bacterium]